MRVYHKVHKPEWSKGGVWYWEVWAEHEGENCRVRVSREPCITKREATEKGLLAVDDCIDWYNKRVGKKEAYK